MSKPKVNKKALDPKKADVVAGLPTGRKGSAPMDAKLEEELKTKLPKQMFKVIAGTETREERVEKKRNPDNIEVKPVKLRIDNN